MWLFLHTSVRHQTKNEVNCLRRQLAWWWLFSLPFFVNNTCSWWPVWHSIQCRIHCLKSCITHYNKAASVFSSPFQLLCAVWASSMKTARETPVTGNSLGSVKSDRVGRLEMSLNRQTKRPENLSARGIHKHPDRRSSQFLLYFLTVIIIAIVCLATVIDC